MHSCVLLLIFKGPVLLQGGYQVFGVGFAGGFLAEAVALYELRHNVAREFPSYLKSPLYWIISLVMAGLGGVLTCLYGIDDVQALLALNIGASAPLIFRSFSHAVPAAKPKID